MSKKKCEWGTYLEMSLREMASQKESAEFSARVRVALFLLI